MYQRKSPDNLKVIIGVIKNFTKNVSPCPTIDDLGEKIYKIFTNYVVSCQRLFQYKFPISMVAEEVALFLQYWIRLMSIVDDWDIISRFGSVGLTVLGRVALCVGFIVHMAVLSLVMLVSGGIELRGIGFGGVEFGSCWVWECWLWQSWEWWHWIWGPGIWRHCVWQHLGIKREIKWHKA